MSKCAKISVYDAFIWLADVKASGLYPFTAQKLKEADKFNPGYFQCLIRRKFIKQNERQKIKCSNNGTYYAIEWILNEKTIRKHQFRHLLL